jgi:death-on-curing protein
MMRYLTIDEILDLHQQIIEQSGGAYGIRDRGALESAVAQPQMMFSGVELYQSLADKAVALGFSLICNHPFIDGNKRIGHAAMETFLVMNGLEIGAGVNEQEDIIIQVASGKLKREGLVVWLLQHLEEQ